MIVNPWSMALLVLDAVTLALLASAAITAIRVVTGWSAGSSSSAQLRLERMAKAGSVQARWVVLLVGCSTVGLVAAVAHALPPLVPGAMCGTGVIQAAGRDGTRALMLQAIALLAVGCWRVTDGLDRSLPTGEATPLASRVLLFASPVIVLAWWARLRALMAINTHKPVDCCASLHDAAAAGSAEPLAGGGSGLVLAAAVCLVTLLMAALWTAAGRGPRSVRQASIVLAFSTLAWLPVAGLTLVTELAPYHYGVLHHSCPWCLFLPEHAAVGYPLLAALLVTGIEGLSALVAIGTAGRVPALAAAARRRARIAGIAVLVSTILFVAISAGPAIAWRIRFGVWIHG